jgi:hypothetical protein
MAGAAAEAGAPEEAAAILKTAGRPSRDCDCLFAGCTHAHNPLPELGFVA